jgi:hypothetical protein
MIKKLRALWLRTLGLLRTRRADDDFAAELESHVAMHTEDGIRAGLSTEEAKRQALIKLGGVEQARQAYRERRTLPWVENALRDMRYAMRTLRREPVVTAVAVISIALGLGANATIFSMVSRFVLRPAPVGEPATLLTIHTTHRTNGDINSFPWPLYRDVRDDARSLSGLAAYYELLPASIGGYGEPERVWGQAATTNFFDVLELRMVLGRGFASNEDTRPVIVLGENLWRRRFNADSGIVGKAIPLSGRSFTVVGIASASLFQICRQRILATSTGLPLWAVCGVEQRERKFRLSLTRWLRVTRKAIRRPIKMAGSSSSRPDRYPHEIEAQF